MDLTRNKYTIIPNPLCEFIESINNKCVDHILSSKLKHKKATDYLNYLKENEFIFFCDTKSELKNFPALSLKYETPYLITNITIENPLNILNEKSIQLFQEINIPHLLLIFTKRINITRLKHLFNKLKESTFRSIELILPYALNINLPELNKLVENNRRISYCLLYGADKEEELVAPFYCFQRIVTTKKKLNEIKTGRIKDESNFTCNMEVFCESQGHNVYLNKKMFIKEDGNIKNSIETPNYYGLLNDIKETSQLKQLINSPRFQKYWNIAKKDMETCSICEFKNICNDNRVPFKKNKQWCFEEDCNYNPYIAKWKGQEGYITVSKFKFSQKTPLTN